VDVGRVYNELGGPPAHRALVERLWRGAIPGINGSFDLNDPSVAGQRFSGECTQLCGTHHRFVRSWVQVVPKDKFNTWLKDYHGPGAATAEGSS
jgi:heme/copper-type cytochrome/quinol oxidase subunit 2